MNLNACPVKATSISWFSQLQGKISILLNYPYITDEFLNEESVKKV
jgi:hypothetical protein